MRPKLCTTFPLPTIKTPPIAQRRQPGAELEVVGERLRRVDRELHDRDVGVREHVHEHRPGAVIDAPAVDVEADPRGIDDVGDLARELRVAGRRILEREELVGEAVEVVDRLRAAASRSRRTR